MILETVSVGQLEVNCYIIASEVNARAIIIDPGEDQAKIRKVLTKYNLRPAFIINTHGHFDHIGCDDKFGVPVYIHSKDAPLLTDPQLNLSSFAASGFSVKATIRTLEDKEIVSLDTLELEVIHLPGHTPGGIALLVRKPEDKILFSGDSLFCMGIGRTDFPGASQELLVKSIKERLLKLDDDVVIYPGHGPLSSIGRERKDNPFLK